MDQSRDTTDRFAPRFDAAGLVTAIVIDADTRALLMVAHMNDAAIRLNAEDGDTYFEPRKATEKLERRQPIAAMAFKVSWSDVTSLSVLNKIKIRPTPDILINGLYVHTCCLCGR